MSLEQPQNISNYIKKMNIKTNSFFKKIYKNKEVFILILGIIFMIFGLLASPKNKTVPHLGQFQNTTLTEKIVPTLSKHEHSQNLFLVTKVFDGDTIEIDTGERVRYVGVNAPEKGEPHSKESTELNSKLILNNKIKLGYDVQDKDRYGRTLAYVFVNNQMVNMEMVKQGLAVSETIQPNVKYQDEFVKAQKEARDDCLGIWSGLCQEASGLRPGGNNCVQITSIKADAVGNDNNNKNGEWIEINNVCSNSVSMNNWLLKDNSASNKYEFKNFVLGSLNSVSLYSGCGEDTGDKLYWQCPEGKYAVWNNSGDHAYLYDNQGNLISDFGY